MVLGIVQVVQGAASLARLADSAGESSSPSTDSDSSSDEDSEYEIEDIYQVWYFFICSICSGPFVRFKSDLEKCFAVVVYLFDATHGVVKQFYRFLIWSDAECKNSTVYALLQNLHPPPTHTHL